MQDGQLKERRRRIIFLFKGRLRGTGSRYMRCDQLAAFTDRYFAESHEISVEVLPRPQHKPAKWRKLLSRAEGAVLILLKGSMDILSEEEFAELRDASAGLAIDHVDSFSGGDVFKQADLHIAASEASRSFMAAKCERIARRDNFDMPRIELVDHHADERIQPTAQPDGRDLKIAYIGNPENTFIPDEIESDMLRFSAEAQSDFEQTLTEIHAAHLHYCIRRETKLRQPKPFTKGFTAARAGRNLICTPAVHDAVRFLGEDYPFMARGEEKKDIVEVVEFARSAIGSPAWQGGLSRINAMQEQVRPENVARQLIAAVDGFY